MASYTCDILSSMEEIDRLADEWRDLHGRCGKGLFVGYDWIRLWWDVLGREQGVQPWLVALRQEGRLVGTLALGIRPYCFLRVLEWAGTDMYDYRDILAESPEVAENLWECARRSKGYDFASIRDVRTDSRSYSCLTAFAVTSRTRRTLSVLVDPVAKADWQKAVPAKQRRNFTRQRKRLEERGSVHFEVLPHDRVSGDVVDSLVRQKLAWCARKNEWGILTPENMRSIFFRLVSLAAKQNQLFLGTLTCGGAPVAHTLAFMDRGNLYGYANTYDETWADVSPGMQTLIETIRWATEHGIKEYDFMRGDESYKQRFANGTHELASFLYPRSLPGWFCVKSLLSCRCLRNRIKTLWAATASGVPGFLKAGHT